MIWTVAAISGRLWPWEWPRASSDPGPVLRQDVCQPKCCGLRPAASPSPSRDKPGTARGSGGRLAMPAELLRLPLRALAELDVDQRRPPEIHRLVERAAQVLRILNVG